MSGSVTYCLNCGSFEWANKTKCSKCGGQLAPTLREVHAQIVRDLKLMKGGKGNAKLA